MTPADVRFAADGMLQSLATWLRMLGYDCLTRTDQSGRRLLEQAVAEERVFLTRNAHLPHCLPAELLARAQILYVVGQHLPEQLAEVVRKFALDTETWTFTRCVICNAPLERAEPPVDGPADVTEFWQCPACRQMFWRGSHVRNSLDRLRRWLAPGG